MPHPEFLSGEFVFAEELEALAARGTYTPELTAITTNPDLGDGTAVGDFYVTGAQVTVMISLTFGSGSSAGSGVYRISLPPGLDVDPAWEQQLFLGSCRLRDNNPIDRETGHFTTVVGTETDRVEIVFGDTVSRVDDDSPWIWTESDTIKGTFTYLLAET